MKGKSKVTIAVAATAIIMVLSLLIGNEYIPPREIVGILLSKFTGVSVNSSVNNASAIILSTRLPRVILAFLSGALLSISGVVMQSVLQNPLASSYTLGVSSGSVLAVSIYIVTGITLPFLGIFTQTIFGFFGGIITVIAVILITSKLDRYMSNLTIVLFGMAFSLFLDALRTLVMYVAKESTKQIMNWQMGSLYLKNHLYNWIFLGLLILGVMFLTALSPQLDNMTFGDDIATTTGVNVRKMKWVFLILGGALTGATVSVIGIIGFIDLIIPHVTRRIFGSSHRVVIPMAAVLGGCFLVLSDIVARTIIAPEEIQVGVVTALLGAPFFVYIYFKKEKI